MTVLREVDMNSWVVCGTAVGGLCSFEQASLLGNNCSTELKTKLNPGIFTVLTEASRGSFLRTWKSTRNVVGPILNPSWGTLCLHHPLPDTWAEELGLTAGPVPRAGMLPWNDRPSGLLQREALETVLAAKINWAGARGWSGATAPSPCLSCPLKKQPTACFSLCFPSLFSFLLETAFF